MDQLGYPEGGPDDHFGDDPLFEAEDDCNVGDLEPNGGGDDYIPMGVLSWERPIVVCGTISSSGDEDYGVFHTLNPVEVEMRITGSGGVSFAIWDAAAEDWVYPAGFPPGIYGDLSADYYTIAVFSSGGQGSYRLELQTL